MVDLSDLYNPFLGTSVFNPQPYQAGISAAQQQAQQAYQQGMLSHQNDALAFTQAQQAFTNAMSLGNAYGYAPGGNWYTFGPGGATIPPAGTPLQSVMNTIGYAGGIPGLTGFNTDPTLAAQNQYFNQAGSAAGLTGQYTAPTQSQYSPGTWVQLDPSSPQSQQYGQQVGYVQANGQIQRVGLAQAAKMGFTNQAVTIPYEQFMALSNAPPTQAPQQTLAAQQAYAQMNAAQQQQALAQANVTGMYTPQAPANQAQQGYAVDGSNWYQQSQATQQAYMQQAGGDPNAAMNAWVAATNQSINQGLTAAGQKPMDYTTNYAYGQYGTPQETLAAQNQYFTQAQNLAQLYGQYYAPSAPGQAAQAGVNAPLQGQETLPYQQFQQQAAQSYLDLLSRLQGPQDYGQYLKVLGATPGGIQSLVGAAAGKFVPGTGVTGQAPQAQTLQGLIGAASGQAGSGAGANAATTGGTYQQGTGGGTASPGGMNYQDFMATAQGLPPPSQIAPQAFNNMLPSQQQMLGSMYSNLGYAPGDINKMYQQSLPKYAAGSAAGQFKLV